MIKMVLLNGLIVLPVVSYLVVRHICPRRVFLFTGAIFGAIVSPWSLGLYSWFHVSSFGLIPGFFGLMMTLVHKPPGFQLAVRFGIVRGIEVSSDPIQYALVEVINGIIWAFCYGVFGCMVDYFRNKKRTGISK
jgi:hypothetical protein